MRVVRSQIVMLACLDNLIKGAAGVAVQNLNLMLGCAEATALFLIDYQTAGCVKSEGRTTPLPGPRQG